MSNSLRTKRKGGGVTCRHSGEDGNVRAIVGGRLQKKQQLHYTLTPLHPAFEKLFHICIDTSIYIILFIDNLGVLVY